MIDMDTIYCCVKNARCFRSEFLFTMLEWDWFFFVPKQPAIRRWVDPRSEPIAVLEDTRYWLSTRSTQAKKIVIDDEQFFAIVPDNEALINDRLQRAFKPGDSFDHLCESLSAASMMFSSGMGKLVAWGVNEIQQREVVEACEKLKQAFAKLESATATYVSNTSPGKKKAQWKQEQRRFRK